MARPVLNVDQPPDIMQRPMGSIPVVVCLVRPDGEEWWPIVGRFFCRIGVHRCGVTGATPRGERSAAPLRWRFPSAVGLGVTYQMARGGFWPGATLLGLANV